MIPKPKRNSNKKEREYSGVQLRLATYAAFIDIEQKNCERTVGSHSNVDV